MDRDILAEMNVTCSGVLDINSSNMDNLIKQSRSAGWDSFMTCSQMYSQLRMLQKLVPRNTQASIRMWIDVFFFRVAAMIPKTEHMILGAENTRNKTLDRTDYTFALFKAEEADEKILTLNTTRDPVLPGLFVTQSRPDSIDEDIPQAIVQMHGRAEILRKNVVRGVLTNGLQWIFLILCLDADGSSGHYKQSAPVNISHITQIQGTPIITDPGPDIIAGILSCWVRKSFSDLDKDDYFTYIERPKMERAS